MAIREEKTRENMRKSGKIYENLSHRSVPPNEFQTQFFMRCNEIESFRKRFGLLSMKFYVYIIFECDFDWKSNRFENGNVLLWKFVLFCCGRL